MSSNISQILRPFVTYQDDEVPSTIPVTFSTMTTSNSSAINSSVPTPVCGKDDAEDTTTMLYGIIALLLLNIALHATGCTLLYKTLDQTRAYIQQLFILNLSLSALLKNILKLIRYIAKLLLEKGSEGIVSPSWCPMAGKVILYCKFLHVWGTYPIYFFMMIYLTVDRLLATVLTITYKMHVTKGKTKCVLISTWFIMGALACGMNMAYGLDGFVVPEPLPAYIYGALHILYVILAVCTYALMFYKFTHSKRVNGSSKGKTFLTSFKKQYSQAFKESKFFVCILIITSFIILSIIPGLFYIPMMIQRVHKTYPHLKLLVHLCYMLSDTVDAIIYIFLQKSIQRLLAGKLFCFRGVKKHSTVHRVHLHTESTSMGGETMAMLKAN